MTSISVNACLSDDLRPGGHLGTDQGTESFPVTSLHSFHAHRQQAFSHFGQGGDAADLHAYARKLLFNAAMSAVRTSGVWRTLYGRERAKGLPSTAALVIVGRKLVRVAFALFKSKAAYDETKIASVADLPLSGAH